MILADTSAWIEFLKRTGTTTARAMHQHLVRDEVATTDIVVLEVLAGTTDRTRVSRWERALDGCTFLPQEPRLDATEAAELYRQCRLSGESPRQLTDCLIAAVALRHGVPVLHRDRDFEVIARHTGLQVVVS